MKATNTSGAAQYSLGWHKFLIKFFLPFMAIVMLVMAVGSLFMFFACGLYETYKISEMFSMWIADLEGGFGKFLIPVIEFVDILLKSIFNLTGGLAPAMHIRHLTVCYLSVGVMVLALMARNALMYFEKKALTLINSFFAALGGYIIVFGWLFQYVLTNFITLKATDFTRVKFFGFRLFAYIKAYYQLFTSKFFTDNLFTGKLFDGKLIPSVHFPEGRDLFADITFLQKWLSNSEVLVTVVFVAALAAISGAFVLICTLYYKKRKSMFEFSI